MTFKKTLKKPLGRGLSALISSSPVAAIAPESRAKEIIPSRPRLVSDSDTNPNEGVRYVSIADVVPNESQPRKEFNTTELQELSISIKELGLIQPIVVRAIKGSDKFQIVAGERRWRAANLAKLAQVPVIIRDLGDRQTLEIALVENIQRSALNPIEEARAYEALIEDFNITQEELARRVGKDRSSIANFLRILKLPVDVLELVNIGKLSMGHAKAILSVREPAAQSNLAKKVLAENLSVRALEDIVGRVVILKTGKSKKKMRSAIYPELEEDLKKILGTKIVIKHKKSGSGKIEIDYYSTEELDRLVSFLRAN